MCVVTLSVVLLHFSILRFDIGYRTWNTWTKSRNEEKNCIRRTDIRPICREWLSTIRFWWMKFSSNEHGSPIKLQQGLVFARHAAHLKTILCAIRFWDKTLHWTHFVSVIRHVEQAKTVFASVHCAYPCKFRHK